MSATRRCLVCDSAGPFAPVWSPPGQPFKLVRCPGCRLVFQHPQPDEQVLAGSYYHDPEFAQLLFGPLREYTLKRAREKLTLLDRSRVVRPGARGLDVGCSSGAWLEVAESAGMRMTGVELGADTARLARSRGLDVHTGTLAERFEELDAERYDLITFWDVLEHLPDPRQDLALAARLLAPGGAVAATFPNVCGWFPRLTYRLVAPLTGIWEYPELPVHLYDFAPSTAAELFGRCGFEIERMTTLPVPFTFYRSTSLALERLGGGLRAWLVRLCFELLRLAVYPVARVFDRQNALFALARPSHGTPAPPATSPR